MNKASNGIDYKNYLDNKRSLLEAFSLAAGLPPINNQPVFYLNAAEPVTKINKPYFVIHSTSNAVIKDWLPEKWNILCDRIINEGFAVCEIGFGKNITICHDDYYDFTGPRPLQSIAQIISNSIFFVGIDSGFAHMANALKKDGLVLIGEYKLQGKTFSNYNPYTGMYNDDSKIVYAKNGAVETIQPEEVISRIRQLKRPVVT